MESEEFSLELPKTGNPPLDSIRPRSISKQAYSPLLALLRNQPEFVTEVKEKWLPTIFVHFIQTLDSSSSFTILQTIKLLLPVLPSSLSLLDSYL
jgi:hypothetical protein